MQTATEPCRSQVRAIFHGVHSVSLPGTTRTPLLARFKGLAADARSLSTAPISGSPKLACAHSASIPYDPESGERRVVAAARLLCAEFKAFMMGDKDTMEMLQDAPKYVEEVAPARPAAQMTRMGSFASRQPADDSSGMDLTAQQFLSRMVGDIEERRKSAFINELKKDPRFKPSSIHTARLPPRPSPRLLMWYTCARRESAVRSLVLKVLEPPKPKFKTVTLDAGPIIKTHKNNRTGLETKRPYKWGPLGGYY